MIKINLETFNESWQKEYFQESDYLLNAISPLKAKIEHIGSTSLSDGIAKPIIDILIGMDNEESVEQATEILTKKGYIYYEVYKTISPERSHLVKVNKSIHIQRITNFEDDIIDEIGVIRKFHLHITKYNSNFWNRHVAFRDFLRENYNVRHEYFNLKKELAKKDWRNMQEYAESKTPFIRNIENRIFKANSGK